MSKRILIVEDELPIAELEKDYLELSGFEVVICSDGTEGMKMATTEKFDMVILDLMLPGTDGFEICKKIRETSEIPIMMVSAKKEDIDKIRGLGLGANDYMTKPFSPSELVARVKAHLERYKKLVGSAMKEENEVIEAGGLKIDRTARRVYVDGVEKNLTTKEFDLLMMFIKNKGIAFSRDKILENVWDENYFGSDRVVDDTLRRLRKKLPNLNIHTIYGYGYRLG